MTDFSKFIREVPDFPQPGILFKDITPLLQDPGKPSAMQWMQWQPTTNRKMSMW